MALTPNTVARAAAYAGRVKGGNAVTSTGRSRFYVYIDLYLSNQTETECDVSAAYGIRVDKGDFYGSRVTTSWGKSGAIGKNGEYLTTTPKKVGRFAYGSRVKLTASSQYTAYNGGTVKSSLSASWEVPFPAAGPLAAPESVQATRLSDTSARVDWVPKGTSTAAYITQNIHMSTDGGKFWTKVYDLSPTASSSVVTGLSAGHVYRFQVEAYNRKSTAASAISAEVRMTPTAPSGTTVTATSKTEATVRAAGRCPSATGMQWQMESNGALGAVHAASSPDFALVEDLGGTGRFRTRFLAGSLVGPWSPWSDWAQFSTVPKPPTLTAPASSAVCPVGEALEFEWVHNPRDGSAQSAAQVRWTLDEEWSVIDVPGEAGSEEIQNEFPTNAAVVWSARTKGASGEWGEWAGNRVLYARARPALSVMSPGPLVDSMPFEISVSYSDDSGDPAQLTARVYDESGAVVLEKAMGSGTSATVERGEWVPEEDAAYTLSVECRSTSGLSSSCESVFSVHFIDPKEVSAAVSFDDATGDATVSISIDPDDEGSDVEAVELWRVVGGSEKLLAPLLLDGGAYDDRWAPLNRTFAYRLVVYAASGAVRVVERECTIDSSWAYFYYGPGWGQVARGIWEVDESYSVSRPGRSLVRYAGREYPVMYDSGHVSDKRSFSAVIEGDDIMAFDDMARNWGRCVAKTLHGDVMCASVEVSVSEHSTLPFGYQTASVSFERIDGDWE